MNIPPNSSLLVDGNAYMYRFFYGREPRYNHEGRATHVVYNFMSFARRLVQFQKPRRLVFVFDAPGDNFRHELYSDYKSHRDPMPDELRHQIDDIKQAIRLLGIPLIEMPDVEADDAIASLSTLLSALDERVFIYSLDKDLLQLVNDKVHMVNDRKGIVMDGDFVMDKYGIEPHRIVELLALTGDEADNIPGVAGIGQVTAAKLINQWGDIENIITNAHWVKGVVGNKLRKGTEDLRLSLKLTKLKEDLFSEEILPHIEFVPEDKASIHTFCKQMGFIE